MRLVALYTVLLLSAFLPFKGSGQSVTDIKSAFNSSDTMVNYIRDPGLIAWNFRCPFNVGANCHVPFSYYSTIMPACNTSNTAQFFNPGFLADGSFTNQATFLSTMQSILGFDDAIGIGAFVQAHDYFGNSFSAWGSDVWLKPSNFHVESTLSGDFTSSNTNGWMCTDSSNHDMNLLINSQSGTTCDSFLGRSYSFQFVSSGTFFDMEYVFASDEYDTNLLDIITYLVNTSANLTMPVDSTMAQRICGGYNEGIGIFLSGPGINGPYSKNAENIATIPGTNLPVCTRTIHPELNISGACGAASYPQYFVQGNHSNFVFDGYTTPLLVKKIPINPCDTYSVTMTIGQANDTTLAVNGGIVAQTLSRLGGSGMLVKRHSAKTSFWQPAPLQLYDGFGQDTLVEGCPGLLMRFVRFFQIGQADSIHLEYQGSAEWGADYDSLPEWVYFLPGEDTLEFMITPSFDTLSESIENLIIRLMPPGEYNCPVDTTEVELWIADRPPLGASIPDTFFFDPCLADSMFIGASAVTGLAPLSFQWSNGDSTWFTSVAPINNASYGLTITDACGYDSLLFTVVTRFAPAPVVQKLSHDTVINCTDSLIPIGIKVLEYYYPQFEYEWTTGETDSVIYVNPLYDGIYNYSLKILRPCMPDSFEYSITVHVENDPIIVQLDDINEVHCPGFTYDLNPTVSGGYLPYAYAWSTSENSLNIQVAPLETDTYFFSVTDVCGLDTIVGRSIVHVPDYDSLDIIGIKRIDLPCPIGYVTIHPDQYIGKGGMSGTTQKLYTFSWDNWKTTGKALQFFTDKDSLLTLRMRDTCNVDEANLEVYVSVFHGPYLSATFPDTLHVCLGDPVILKPDVQDGVPPYTYQWTNGSSDSVKAIVQSEALQSYRVTVSDFCDFHEEKTALVKATRPVAGYEAMNDSYDPLLVSFDNQSTGAVMYSWYFGDQTTSNEENPQLHLETLSQTQVKLVVEDRYGCQDSIDGMLDIPLNLFIPNAFTPNGDFLNETWIPLGYGFETLEYTIFDRWGNEVYQCNRPDCFEWNGSSHGTLLPTATYSYLLIVKPINQREQQVHGQVTLVR